MNRLSTELLAEKREITDAKKSAYSVCLPCLFVLAGCSDLGVKPGNVGLILAQQEMNLIIDPIGSSLNDHIYFSTKASSGGQRFWHVGGIAVN